MPADWEELSETLQSDTNGTLTMIDSDIDMVPEESLEEIDSETQEFEAAEKSDELEINTTLEFEDKGESEEGIEHTDVDNEEIEDYEDEQEELENLSREDNNLDIVKPVEINADINGSLNILRKYIKISNPNLEIAMDNGREQRPIKKRVA